MVGLLCLMTLTDLQTRRAGLSASAEVLVKYRKSIEYFGSILYSLHFGLANLEINDEQDGYP